MARVGGGRPGGGKGTGTRGAAKGAGKGLKGTGLRGRREKVRSKTLKDSSRRWLERHINDPFVRRAQAEGWRSRAAFKLIEADERFGLLRRGARVVDLGAAPGGWAQVASKRTGSTGESPLVVGIDLLPIDPIPGVVLREGDFLDDDAESFLLGTLDGAPDLVMSDMAAATIGHRRTDHLRTIALGEAAADFAIRSLAPGGAFLMKTFQGGTERTLLDTLKRNFEAVHHFKPDSSRKESPELYLLARGFRGRRDGGADGGADGGTDG